MSKNDAPAASPAAETITLTRAQLDAAIASGVAAGLAQQPKRGTLDEQVTAQMAQQRPRGQAPDLVPCVSRVEYGGTGSSYLAVVVRGRVVNLHHHRKPIGWEKQLPEGMILEHKGETPALTKQYLYETYYKRDLQAVGRPLNPAFKMTDEEAKVAAFPPPPEGAGIGSAEAAVVS